MALLAGVLWLAPSLAVAQTRAFEKAPGKLEMRVKSSHPAIRSGAPFALELEFDSTFPDVIEGPLELEFSDDKHLQTRFTTTPFAIPADTKTSYQVQLPSMSCLRTPTEFQVHVVLDSKRRTFELGTHDLLVPIRGMRQFVIAAPGLNQVDIAALVRNLSLDEFRPQKLNRQNFATFAVELDAHRILGDSIALYPYDVLVFAGQHFSALSPRQLETLAIWTESGGGLVVVPTEVLGEAHRGFLAKLAGVDRTDFQTDALGRLPRLGPGEAGWLTTCRLGFGRALVLRSIPQLAPKDAQPPPSRTDWIRAVTFLWNVRSDQVDSIKKTGYWTLPSAPRPKLAKGQNPMFVSTDLKYASYGDPGGLRSEEPAAAVNLRDMLFPADVRVVPFGVVVGLLASFLVIVAPADYCILGWLRRRRYTWIVFPCVSLLFTTLTVCIAGYYSGNTDHRGALVIVDVGQGGRPLRTTRIVHVITADTHRLTADVHDGLFAKTDVQPAQPNTTTPISFPANAKTSYSEPAKDPLDEPPIILEDDVAYEGLLPSAYSVTWRSRQWSPAMHRLTRAGSDVEMPNLDWSELDRLDLASETGRNLAAERLRRALPQCSVSFTSATTDVAIPSVEASESSTSRFEDWPKVLASLGRRRDHGLMGILFGLSPNGAGDLEDLAVLDDADQATWIVHAAIVQGNDLIVFRHVVRKGPTRAVDARKAQASKVPAKNSTDERRDRHQP